MSVIVYTDYTERSYVLVGPFDEDLSYFRDGVLKDFSWMKKGKYKVGSGWCFPSKRWGEVREELHRSGIDYQEEDTPVELKGQGRKARMKPTDEPEEVTIHLEYSPKAHVMTGGFQYRYKDFKDTKLKGKTGFRYGTFTVGKGWTFPQTRLKDVKDALTEAGIPYRTYSKNTS